MSLLLRSSLLLYRKSNLTRCSRTSKPEVIAFAHVIGMDNTSSGKRWWPETGSNRRRRPFQGRALPLSYLALAYACRLRTNSSSSRKNSGEERQVLTPEPERRFFRLERLLNGSHIDRLKAFADPRSANVVRVYQAESDAPNRTPLLSIRSASPA